MKKTLLLLAFMTLPFFAFSQNVEQEAAEQQVEELNCYFYNIVTFTGKLNNEGITVDIDDGKEIKKLRDKDGRKMKFATPAAVLMYLASEGWELCADGSTSNSNNSSNTFYWIIRKPCTKSDLERAVVQGRK